jgi:membrane-bound serine protease (ClpP class)
MVHETGDVIRWNGLGGTVRVHGEVWSARADAPLSASDAIEVVARDGLTLIVRRRHVEGDRHA